MRTRSHKTATPSPSTEFTIQRTYVQILVSWYIKRLGKLCTTTTGSPTQRRNGNRNTSQGQAPTNYPPIAPKNPAVRLVRFGSVRFATVGCIFAAEKNGALLFFTWGNHLRRIWTGPEATVSVSLRGGEGSRRAEYVYRVVHLRFLFWCKHAPTMA